MSKPIKITEQFLNECRADFEKALQLTKLADGKISFTKTFTAGNEKAVVLFTPIAWAKMVMLIKEFDKEVAWHGVAFRSDNTEANEYIIKDILVYPQEVTQTTVEMDTEKYSQWLIDNIEDERFNNIRMQGHSHVNMGVTPSSVDLNHQEEILNMLGDDDFYIFMIWNKSFASFAKIYDMRKNLLFENGDISTEVIGENEDLGEFIKSAKGMVETKYTYNNTGYGQYGNNGYGNTGYGAYPNNIIEASSYTQGKASDEKKDKKSEGKKAEKKEKNKKDKPRTRIGAGWHGLNSQEIEDLYSKGYYD